MMAVDLHADRDASRLQDPAIVAQCRHSLDTTGACVLPGFLSPAAVAEARGNALTAEARAHQVDHLFEYDDTYPMAAAMPLSRLPASHPRRHRSLTRIRFVGKDLIPRNDPVMRLHRHPDMAGFVAAVLGLSRVLPSPCPLSGCIFTIAAAGELQDWHFDSNDFIVTLMLEAPGDGGAFEYVPGLREPGGDDDFAGVRAAFDGQHDEQVTLNLAPGSLTLFKGRYNFHRAAPVRGGGRRVMAILSFDERPGYVAPPEHLMRFYGRAVPLDDAPGAG